MKNKGISVALAITLGLSGCNRPSPESYSELIILYHGEDKNYRRFVSKEELNFGNTCTASFKDRDVFDRCLDFYGRSCFVEKWTRPNHSTTFCPKGCDGRCVVAIWR